MDEDEMDYGSWLEEDLRDLYKDLIKRRDRSELYSDRVDLNRTALKIMGELHKRNNSNG